MNFEETQFSIECEGGLGILSFSFLLAKTVEVEGKFPFISFAVSYL